MADWNQLVIKVDEVVGTARDYLQKRADDPGKSLEERERLTDWLAQLEKAAFEVKTATGQVVQVDDFVGEIYRRGLQLSQEQIQHLHEYYDYSGVESVMRGLHQHLLAMTGPNGPGGGRPETRGFNWGIPGPDTHGDGGGKP